MVIVMVMVMGVRDTEGDAQGSAGAWEWGY